MLRHQHRQLAASIFDQANIESCKLPGTKLMPGMHTSCAVSWLAGMQGVCVRG